MFIQSNWKLIIVLGKGTDTLALKCTATRSRSCVNRQGETKVGNNGSLPQYFVTANNPLKET